MRYFFYIILYGLGLSVAYTLAPFHPKIRRGLRGRRALMDRVKARFGSTVRGRRCLWFHVASSGELEQCLPLLDRIRQVSPETEIALTYFSPSAKEGLKRELERRRLTGRSASWDYADFSPFDFPWTVRSFLFWVKPSAFISIYRELWPGILNECRKKGIPRFVFATSLTKDRDTVSAHEKWLFGLQNFIGTIDQKTSKLLSEVSGPRIERVGDPRIERVLDRKRMAPPSALPDWPKEKRYFVLASVWDEDLDALLPAVEKLLSRHPHWQVVIVPHEASEKILTRLRDWASAIKLPFEPWSHWSGGNTVVARTGILAELYQMASLVFVGGSFKAKVHNVLEPAAYGRPIITGPHMQNSVEAQDLAHRGALLVAADAEELGLLIRSLTDDIENQSRRISGLLNEYLTEGSGASERCLAALRSFHLLGPALSFH